MHLLRPFMGFDLPKSQNTLEGLQRRLERVREARRLDVVIWTTKVPSRLDELTGGSIYFVRGRRTLFRMAILRIVRREHSVGFGLEPYAHPVDQKYVGMVQGWRYLKPEDAPRDLPPPKPEGSDNASSV